MGIFEAFVKILLSNNNLQINVILISYLLLSIHFYFVLKRDHWKKRCFSLKSRLPFTLSLLQKIFEIGLFLFFISLVFLQLTGWLVFNPGSRDHILLKVDQSDQTLDAHEFYLLRIILRRNLLTEWHELYYHVYHRLEDKRGTPNYVFVISLQY